MTQDRHCTASIFKSHMVCFMDKLLSCRDTPPVLHAAAYQSVPESGLLRVMVSKLQRDEQENDRTEAVKRGHLQI